MAESPWSQLPRDILTAIAKTLGTRTDVLRLRSVCNSWRSSIHPFESKPYFPATLPFPISPNPEINKNRRGRYTLSQNTVYFVLPPQQNSKVQEPRSGVKPWLVRAEELSNGKLRPLHPVSSDLTKNAPREFPKVLNLLNFRIYEIGTSLGLQFVEHGSKRGIRATSGDAEGSRELIYKVAVSSTPLTPGGDDYVIMAIHDARLGYIKLGDEKWNEIDSLRMCVDVVYHKGRFYVVDFEGKTVVIGSDFKPRVVASVTSGRIGDFKYLVGSGEDLFLVDRHDEMEHYVLFDYDFGDYTVDFRNPGLDFHLKYYRLNEKEKRWEQEYSLGDRVFFVGDDCSYVVSVGDFPGLKGDCIFITDESLGSSENKNLGDLCANLGVFTLEDGKGGPLASFDDLSNIFWPPPDWLRPPIQWSQLPKDILVMISRSLPTHIDILRLRSVCYSWRSSIPPFKEKPSFPITLPFPISSNPERKKNSRPGRYTLSKNTTYLILPPQNEKSKESQSNVIPWLFRVDALRNGKFHPLHALSKDLTEKLPSEFPKVLNMLNFQIFEVAKSFSLQVLENKRKKQMGFGRNDDEHTERIHKVAVSSSPLTPNDDDYVVMVIHSARLSYITLGDGRWNVIDTLRVCVDVVYHKNQFYVVDYEGKTVVIGTDLKPVEVARSVPGCSGDFKHLVSSGEDLFLIDRHSEKEQCIWYDSELGVDIHLKYYMLNEKEKEWEQVHSLGDKVFFVGDDGSFAVSACAFPGLKGGCVYISDESFAGKNKSLGGLCANIGVFSLEDCQGGALASFESHSKIFWPPPTWLQSTNKRAVRSKKHHSNK